MTYFEDLFPFGSRVTVRVHRGSPFLGLGGQPCPPGSNFGVVGYSYRHGTVYLLLSGDGRRLVHLNRGVSLLTKNIVACGGKSTYEECDLSLSGYLLTEYRVSPTRGDGKLSTRFFVMLIEISYYLGKSQEWLVEWAPKATRDLLFERDPERRNIGKLLYSSLESREQAHRAYVIVNRNNPRVSLEFIRMKKAGLFEGLDVDLCA